MNITTKLSALVFAAVLATACSPADDGNNAVNNSAAPAAAAGTDADDGQSASATGTVTAVDPAAGTVTIDHGPVPAMQWPAMTMGFKATPEQLSQVTVGQLVQFEFAMRDTEATITSISPAGP